MRCGRAQKLMVTAIEGGITPARRRALDQHVSECAACRRELAATQSLFGALGSLSTVEEVPALVEAATLRRMRIAAAEEREGGQRRWGWLPAPMLAAAGVGVLALVIVTRPGNLDAPVRSTAPEPAATQRVTRAPAAAAGPVTAPREEAAIASAAVAPPEEPPPDLAAAPELFMNLPIIRNMEKLEHFEAITMIELAPNG